MDGQREREGGSARRMDGRTDRHMDGLRDGEGWWEGGRD